MPEKIEIADVTPEQAGNLRAFLGRDHLKGHEADEGTVRGDCIDVSYKYDAGSGLLVVEPSKLPEHLQDEPGSEPGTALRETIQKALISVQGRCGIYMYVETTIKNTSGQLLTYSTQTLENGSVDVKSAGQSIPNGKEVYAFEANNRKGSGLGAAGQVVYTLADGITKLMLTYTLFTVWDSSFSAGLDGGNAARYEVKSETISPSIDGDTYMKPKVTISQRA